MSQFADAVARLTIDKDFARDTRREPERVATLYRLTPQEAAKLRELADAAITDRAAALSALLAVPPFVVLVSPSPGAESAALGFPLSMPTLLTVPLPTPLDAAA
jgi:hypothetical protein